MTQPTDDIERVVLTARSADPSIDPAGGAAVARGCVDLLAAEPSLDAPELARRYLTEHADADASWVAHIARALAG
jgi:hypothetical protein